MSARTKHLKVLGLDEKADEATIKKAFKKLALLYHPDRNSNNVEEATERFPETAYEIQGLVHNHLAEAYEANQDKDKAIEASRATVDYFERLAKAASERGLAASPPVWVDEAKARIARLEGAS